MRVGVLAAGMIVAGALSGAPAALAAETSSYADYLVGSYAKRMSDPVAARERLEAALSASPRDPVLLATAAETALAAGDVDEAARYGRRARAVGADSAAGRLASAALAMRRGAFAQARTALQGAEAQSVEDVCGKLIDAWARLGLKDVDGAVAALGPDPAGGQRGWLVYQHYLRGLMFDAASRPADAAAAYAAGGALGGLRIAQVTLRHGAVLSQAGRKADALALYRDFLRDIDNPGIRAAMADLERGAPPPALSPASGASISLFGLAVLLDQSPESDGERTPLALSMALDPGFEGARLGFADAMREAGREDVVRKALEAVPNASPYAETARTQIALSLHRDKRDEEALALLNALVRDGGGRIARQGLADLYRMLERYSDAADLYGAIARDAEPLQQRDWRLLFAHAAALERAGRWPEAEPVFQRALQLSPDQPEVLNYLGYQWVDSGARVREGLALLQKAAAQRPNEGYIVDSLGWAYYRLADYERAVTLLELAAELSPGDVTVNDHLGDAYWRVGRRIEARFQWRRVLTLEPTDAERRAAERKLAEGLPAQPAP